MPTVTEPTLDIDITIQDGCLGLTLNDSTGLYPTKSGGYGLPSGPAVNSVETVTITNTYSSLGSDVVYTFLVTNGTITVATISVGGGSPTTITSSLDSTVWPFVDFDMNKDYGLTLPTFEDDIYSIQYKIAGFVGLDAFEFSVTEVVPVECQATCCRDKKFIDLELNCSCTDNDTVLDALFLDALIKQAFYDSGYGYQAEAAAALNKAKTICADSGCGC